MAQPSRSQRVLVVDDDPTVLQSVTRVLGRAGYDVHTHESGFGLIVALRGFRPDLVLLDLEMPGLSGDAALRAAGGFSSVDVPMPRCILFSGVAPEELQARAQRLGAGVLNKPATRKAILAAVQDALAA